MSRCADVGESESVSVFEFEFVFEGAWVRGGQLRRALLATFLGIAEGSSRTGSDRLARFRCARGEASEAAAALEAVSLLRLAPNDEVERALALLDRLCAKLTRLAGLSHRQHPPP